MGGWLQEIDNVPDNGKLRDECINLNIGMLGDICAGPRNPQLFHFSYWGLYWSLVLHLTDYVNISWHSQHFYKVFVWGLNWDLSKLTDPLLTGLWVTKWQSMKDKNFTWQTLIVTKAELTVRTQKRCPEKNRESWLWERWGKRVGVGTLEYHWKVLGAQYSGRMGHHDSPAGRKHFH